jgi:hypothetical protein
MKRRLLLLAVVLVFGTSAASAQPPGTADLRGTIKDQTEGVIVGASVMLQDANGQNGPIVTDADGTFSFNQLVPGRYTLTVKADGFRDSVTQVNLRPRRPVSVEVELQLAIEVSVDVKEQEVAPTDPRRNLSSMILTGKDIEALPSDPTAFRRRLLELATSTGRPGDVALFVDGFREIDRLPPREAIEMIRINANPFSAEFLQPGEKRIEITTKPGSDGFHGELDLEFRDSVLNARNALAPSKPAQRNRNGNGYLQGPIKKGTMGFLFYGGRWQQEENAVIHATVPDVLTGHAQPFSATIVTPASITSVFLKTDLQVHRQVFSVSYARTDERRDNQGLESGFDLPERAYTREGTEEEARLVWTSIASRALNDFRLEVTRNLTGTRPALRAPAVLVLNAFHGGGNQEAGFEQTSLAGVQAIETLTVQHGNHGLKTGIQFESGRQHSIDRSGFGGIFTFGSDWERDASGAPLLNAAGRPMPISPLDAYRRTIQGIAGYGPSQFSVALGDPDIAVSQWQLGWFALDDWVVSKRLTLSYGFRLQAQNHLARRLRPAPRAGLAWQLDEDGLNVIRVGAGVFPRPVDMDITFETRKLDGLRQQQLRVQNPGVFPGFPPSLEGASVTKSSVYRKAADLGMPYTSIASAAYERGLPWNMSATVQYQLQKGSALLRLRNVNAPTTPGPIAPDRAPVFQFESNGRSLRHELLIALRGDFTSRFSTYANYTLGRMQSDTDGSHSAPASSYDLAAEFGAAAGDRRHQFVSGATLQFPSGIFLSPYFAIATGRPFNIITGRDNNNDTLFTDRPAFASAGDEQAIETRYGLLNPNPQPGDRLIPRNLGREPMEVTLSLNASKVLFKGLMITVNADNLLNTTRLAGTDSILTSPTFGIPNRALDGRHVELGLRYNF